jgi:hypothetical protein
VEVLRVTHFWQDARYSIRVLRKAPAVTLVAVVSLALGIGANSAIFSLINALILRSLPVRDPQQLVTVSTVVGDVSDRSGKKGLSLPMLEEIEKRQQVFSGMLAWGEGLATIQVNGTNYPGSLTAVSGSYFSVLAVQPLLGRLITQEDVGTPVAVLDYRCWQRRYNSAPDVVGRAIRVDGRPLTIIGVTPKSSPA